MAKGEDSVDPIQGEFFASEEIGDLSEILVREAIQNSLDARIDKKNRPAEVVISYRISDYTFEQLQSDGMPLAGLIEHAGAENSGLHTGKLPQANDMVDYLVVEDFGTCGLNGDPSYNDDERPVSTIPGKFFDFFFFWRNIGRSGKVDGLGSWGLGKHVFPAASRINSYFGLTCRSEDREKLLMGKSILKIHHHKKCKYAPYGYYGCFAEEEFFALPFSLQDQITAFTEVFKLRRQDESGLSVVIPFPKIGLLSVDPLVEAVLKDYFYPVIRNRLKVTISYEGCEDIVIDSSTVKAVARQYLSGDEMLLETIDLAIWSASLTDDDVIALDVKNLYRIPSVADLEIPDDTLARIRESIEINGRVALRVPVRVASNDLDHKKGEFDICFAQTDIAKCVNAKYIRQGIDVKNANRVKLDAGCIALVEVHDLLLGKLLRVSEPPAHDRWEQRNNEDLAEKYDRGSATIGFVKKAPHEIWRRIARKNLEQNRDLLRDIFHLDLSDISFGKKPKDGKKKKKKKDDVIDIEKRDRIRMVRTKKTENGFTVSNDNDATHTPKTITISAAYRVAAGNHLKKYSPLDFRLDKKPISIEKSGVEATNCSENHMVVTVLEPEFEIKVTGFDLNRDLVVQVVSEKEDDDDQEV